MALADVSPTSTVTLGCDEYRRHARRLRARFAGEPARLHHSLAQLARRRDAATSSGSASWKPSPDTRPRLGHPAPVRVSVRPRVQGAPAALLPADGLDGLNGAIFQSSPKTLQRFAALVTHCMEDGILRYSRRQALLRRAERLGIARFEANLIMAAVVNRRPHPREGASEQPRGRLPLQTALLVFTFVETLVAVAAWCALHH